MRLRTGRRRRGVRWRRCSPGMAGKRAGRLGRRRRRSTGRRRSPPRRRTAVQAGSCSCGESRRARGGAACACVSRALRYVHAQLPRRRRASLAPSAPCRAAPLCPACVQRRQRTSQGRAAPPLGTGSSASRGRMRRRPPQARLLDARPPRCRWGRSSAPCRTPSCLRSVPGATGPAEPRRAPHTPPAPRKSRRQLARTAPERRRGPRAGRGTGRCPWPVHSLMTSVPLLLRWPLVMYGLHGLAAQIAGDSPPERDDIREWCGSQRALYRLFIPFETPLSTLQPALCWVAASSRRRALPRPLPIPTPPAPHITGARPVPYRPTVPALCAQRRAHKSAVWRPGSRVARWPQRR